MNHRNILEIRQILAEGNPTGSLYLVFDFMSSDLQGLMNSPAIKFEVTHFKNIMLQILHGIDYMHRMNIAHRDLKGANILVSSSGRVQIADFGLTRNLTPMDKNALYT